MVEKHKVIIYILVIFFILGIGFGAGKSFALVDKDKIQYRNGMLKRENEFLKETLNINFSQKDVNYMYGTATAYTPAMGGINSDSNSKVTSTGKPAKNGVIAVNPDIIPYGSEVMIISGNKVIRGKAEDTGGAMRQNPTQVDILMENHEDALEWGRKEVHIIWW